MVLDEILKVGKIARLLYVIIAAPPVWPYSAFLFIAKSIKCVENFL
jgi:hypothetical protein